MATNYAIPGVYIEEISQFPPSIAQVETAIPAFVGYTERTADALGESYIDRPIRVSSQKDYERIFGLGPRPTVSSIDLDARLNFVSADFTQEFLLYDAIRLFYANGGGDCYIVSIGDYGSTITENDFTDTDRALEKIAGVDEPTILLFPDAARLTAAQLGNIQKKALLQCINLMDRVTLCDTLESDPTGTNFRQQIGINGLKYGMAYTPWLRVILTKNLAYRDLRDVDVSIAGGVPITINNNALHNGDADIVSILDTYDDLVDLQEAFEDYMIDALGTGADATDFDTALATVDAAITAPPPANYTSAKSTFDTALTTYQAATPADDEALAATRAPLQAAFEELHAALTGIYQSEQSLLSSFAVYQRIVTGIQNTATTVPPSGAMAGVYAFVDRTRGVWKAPANVSLNAVAGPTVGFTQSQLSALNIDTTAGKSINAIRTFTGRGAAVVWGARTLAGNDNEWRYVSVRRFYNMVEESVKKACEQFVFEPNDANTWVRVQAMIENFLTLQWRQGALQGAKQEHAFRVAVGLGKTMTAVDILEGRMIVEIAMAPVRPAEFIILRFSQKMAAS